MNDQQEAPQIDASELIDVEVDQRTSMLQFAFLDQPTANLLPLILALHQLWKDDEAHRIIAFFMANPAIAGSAKTLMGLDVLEWGEKMYEDAVETDSFNKLFVMALAGYFPEVEDMPQALNEAIENKRYGMLLALLAMKGPQVAATLGKTWANRYTTLAAPGIGDPYMCAQALNGNVFEHAKEDWKAGLPKIADTMDAKYSMETRLGYLESQAQAISLDLTRMVISYKAN